MHVSVQHRDTPEVHRPEAYIYRPARLPNSFFNTTTLNMVLPNFGRERQKALAGVVLVLAAVHLLLQRRRNRPVQDEQPQPPAPQPPVFNTARVRTMREEGGGRESAEREGEETRGREARVMGKREGG